MGELSLHATSARAGTDGAPVDAVANAGNIAGVVLAHLVAVAGCYNPEVKDCTVQCSAETDCTGGQTCKSGWCVQADKECPKGGGGDDDNDLTPDAAALTDDAAADNALCLERCQNGTCVDGVCVRDCSAPYTCRSSDIFCPSGVPCRVICGDHACDHKVICTNATSCEVQCSGTSACSDEIQCGAGRCTVTCSGQDSCLKRTRCSSSCGCDVACTGLGSCNEVSECPSSTCRLGNGCNSQLAGCDSC